MTLAINNLGYLRKKRSKCPRRRASVDGPSPYAAQQPLRGRMPRRSSCPNLKKNVAFSEHSNIRIVLHSHDDSAIDKWYSTDDHLRFKIDRTIEVRSFRKKAETAVKQVATTALCPVGIEQFLSTKALEATKLNRKLAIKKVLLEQMRQRALGFRDPDQLASVAEEVSIESLKGAQKRGKFQEMSRFV